MLGVHEGTQEQGQGGEAAAGPSLWITSGPWNLAKATGSAALVQQGKELHPLLVCDEPNPFPSTAGTLASPRTTRGGRGCSYNLGTYVTTDESHLASALMKVLLSYPESPSQRHGRGTLRSGATPQFRGRGGQASSPAHPWDLSRGTAPNAAHSLPSRGSSWAFCESAQGAQSPPAP